MEPLQDIAITFTRESGFASVASGTTLVPGMGAGELFIFLTHPDLPPPLSFVKERCSYDLVSSTGRSRTYAAQYRAQVSVMGRTSESVMPFVIEPSKVAEDGGRVTMRLAKEGFLKRLEIHFEIKPEGQQGKQQQGKRREEQKEGQQEEGSPPALPLAAAGGGRPIGCIMQVSQKIAVALPTFDPLSRRIVQSVNGGQVSQVLRDVRLHAGNACAKRGTAWRMPKMQLPKLPGIKAPV